MSEPAAASDHREELRLAHAHIAQLETALTKERGALMHLRPIEELARRFGWCEAMSRPLYLYLKDAIDEKDAALAAAHEALGTATSNWARRSHCVPTWWFFCRYCATDGAGTIDGVEHKTGCPIIASSGATIARAAEELRLLRALVPRAQRALVLAAERWPELKEIQAELAPPLVALQRFREEQG